MPHGWPAIVLLAALALAAESEPACSGEETCSSRASAEDRSGQDSSGLSAAAGQDLSTQDASSASGAAGPKVKWIYGLYRKTGTAVLMPLAWRQAILTEDRMCISRAVKFANATYCGEDPHARVQTILDMDWTHLQALQQEPGVSLRVLNTIRDPLTMAVSAYIYNMNNTEGDTDPLLLEAGILNMSLADGLRICTEFMLKYHMRPMVSVYKNAPEAYHVRMESLTSSSESYNATVRGIFDYMVGDIVPKARIEEMVGSMQQYNLRSPRSKTRTVPGHVATAADKERVTAQLHTLPEGVLAELMAMRATLGYE